MKIFEKKGMMIVLGIAAVLMIAGTFADLAISQAIVNQESLMGKITAAAGEFPIILTGWSTSALFLAAMDPRKTKEKTVTYILAAGFAVFGLIGPYKAVDHGEGMLGIVTALIEVILGGAFAFWVWKSADRSDRVRLRSAAMLVGASAVLSLGLIYVMKIPWGRPRYRTVIAVDGLEFQPWYQIGKTAKETFTALGVDGDEFKSFPSGHAATAVTSLCLLFLNGAVPAVKKQEKLITVLSLIFIVWVMIFRVVSGAHFLSDVTFSAAVTYLLSAVMYRIGKKENVFGNIR